MSPTLEDVKEEVTRRVNTTLCSGCRRARKPVDMWCWNCLLQALRTALVGWP